MGIGGMENKKKINDTGDLIKSLKKVFGNTELKLIVECLQKLKQAKDGLEQIQNVLRSLGRAIFKD